MRLAESVRESLLTIDADRMAGNLLVFNERKSHMRTNRIVTMAPLMVASAFALHVLWGGAGGEQASQ